MIRTVWVLFLAVVAAPGTVFADTIQRARENVRLAPQSANARYNLANALYARGRTQEAIEAYNQAVRLNPSDHEIHNNLASVYHDQGLTEEAVQHYRLARDLNPRSAEVRYNLANALVDNQQARKAIREYEKALRLKPDFELAKENLLSVLYSQGMTKKAERVKRDYQRRKERRLRDSTRDRAYGGKPEEAPRRKFVFMGGRSAAPGTLEAAESKKWPAKKAAAPKRPRPEKVSAKSPVKTKRSSSKHKDPKERKKFIFMGSAS